MEESQTSLTCANLEAQFMSSYKVKRPLRNCCPGPNSRYLSAMTMDQNQLSITTQTQERYSPRETINSSLIFPTNWGRPNLSKSIFPLLCHVRGSMTNYNPHCNQEVSVFNQRDNVRSLKPRMMITRMPESFERKRRLTIVTSMILSPKRKTMTSHIIRTLHLYIRQCWDQKIHGYSEIYTTRKANLQSIKPVWW